MINLMDKKVKCLIVQTKFSAFSFWNYLDVCELIGARYPAAPLGLITVAGLLPQSWEFKLVDQNIETLEPENFEWADIVCTGGMLPQQQEIISLIRQAHEYDCKVVIGGPDPTSQPHIYQEADYIVLGEGEITIPMFIEALENNCQSGEFKSSKMANMAEAALPRFDLLKFQYYIQVGVQYSRGCPFNCEFCDIIELYGRKPRVKTSQQVIKELQTLHDLGYRGHVDFVDDNFIGNKRNVKQVLPVIKEWSQKNHYPFYFTTEASINLGDDEVLMQMMKEVDFRFVFIGIETPENDSLRATQKRQNVNKPIIETVKKIYSYGMAVNSGFILGFDTESKNIAQNMIDCIQQSGMVMAMLGMLYALPDTQLTRRLRRENRLFVEGNNLSGKTLEIDQATSGLNFLTQRKRLDILEDFAKVLSAIYSPKKYFHRVTYTALNLRPANKYRPNFKKILKSAKAFFKLSRKLGFKKQTFKLYWKMIFTILIKNPKAIEAAVNLAAMFIHFNKQSQFIVNLTHEKIKYIQDYGEENYNELMMKDNPNYALKKLDKEQFLPVLSSKK